MIRHTGELPRTVTLVCGSQVELPAELRVPQCTVPSSCLKMMPPNEQSATVFDSTRTSLNLVFTLALPACTSNTMPPVCLEASQPVWKVTPGALSAVSPPIQFTWPVTSWT